MNQAKLKNTKVAYPTGNQFMKVIKNVMKSTNMEVTDLPQVTINGMNHDQQLFTALVSIISVLMGAGVMSIPDGTKFLSSEDMIALKDDTFGTYFENGSRARCYKMLQQYE